jgi:hypothetical protein
VYLVSPEGHLIDSMHVAQAAETKSLLPWLERVATDSGVVPGQPLIAPECLARRQKPTAAALLLHLTARRESRGSWGEFPSENWIALSAGEVRQLTGPADAKPSHSWEVPREVAYTLLRHFHPQTEDCSDADRNEVKSLSLRVTVESAAADTTRLRIEGSLRMKRPFYPNHTDDNHVDATLIGYATVRSGKVDSFSLVTDHAVYAKEKFDVAVTRIPGKSSYRD